MVVPVTDVVPSSPPPVSTHCHKAIDFHNNEVGEHMIMRLFFSPLILMFSMFYLDLVSAVVSLICSCFCYCC